ncbi:MAG: hypothetical protein AAF171_08730 [Cyanobacteria bacterium P01_A01_bin.116]
MFVLHSQSFPDSPSIASRAELPFPEDARHQQVHFAPSCPVDGNVECGLFVHGQRWDPASLYGARECGQQRSQQVGTSR